MDLDVFDGLLAGMSLLFASAVITPLFAARRQLAGWLNFLFCLAASVILAAISVAVLSGHAPGAARVVSAGPLAFPFLIDGFSALFLAMIALMGSLSALYCIGYLAMDHYRQYSPRTFYANYPLFLAGMVGIVTVDDLTTGFSVAWQAMTIGSYFLIRFDHHDRKVVFSANKYLLLMELAWLVIVAAALIPPHSALGSPLHALTEGLSTATPPVRAVVYGLLLLGFGMKAGMFPLGQLWLPDAHSSAPSPISALLSGVMIKTGVYGLVRTLFWMVPAGREATDARLLGLILACIGVVTLFIGTVQALKQHDAKRLHAYHSLGQMGYILLGIGTAQYFLLSGSPVLDMLGVLALVGGIYHSINHVLFKGLLFLCTGSVQCATGTKDLDRLGGLLKLMPITAFAAAVASASIAGIPAFSGFTSKWAIIASGLLSGKGAGVIVLFAVVALTTSAITLASYVKFFGATFTSAGVEWSGRPDVKEVGAVMAVPMLALAAICLAQGFFPWLFVSLIIHVFAGSEGSIAQPLFGDPAIPQHLAQSYAGLTFSLANGTGAAAVATAMPLVLLTVFALAYLATTWLHRAGGAPQRSAAVWLCGYQTPNDANRYLSSHIYASFKKFMQWTGGNVPHAGRGSGQAGGAR